MGKRVGLARVDPLPVVITLERMEGSLASIVSLKTILGGGGGAEGLAPCRSCHAGLVSGGMKSQTKFLHLSDPPYYRLGVVLATPPHRKMQCYRNLTFTDINDIIFKLNLIMIYF